MIATDKTHLMHEGYWKGDPKVMAYVQGIYDRAHGSKPVPSPAQAHSSAVEVSIGDGREGIELTTSGDDDGRFERAHTDALAALRQEFGDDFTLDRQEDPDAVRAKFQHEWGAEFEQNLANVTNLGGQLLRRDPQLFLEAAALLGDTRGMRLLHLMRQMLTTYRG
jgi:hypothetical protein